MRSWGSAAGSWRASPTARCSTTSARSPSRCSLLHKVEPLTDDEWQPLRRHPEIGANICGPLHVARDIAPIIRHHHERWDGSGYPDGLAGEAIPLGARIVALADAYDVIVRGRAVPGREEPPGGGRGAAALRRDAVRPGPRAAVHRGDRAAGVGCAADRRRCHRPRCWTATCPSCRASGSRAEPSMGTAARRGRAAGRGGGRGVRARAASSITWSGSCSRRISGAYVRVRVEGAEQLPADGWLHRLLQPPQLARPHRHRRRGGRTRSGCCTSSVRARRTCRSASGTISSPGPVEASRSSPMAPTRSMPPDARSPCCAPARCSRSPGREGSPTTRATPLPFEPGVGHFAQLARVPIVPLSIDGTRWVHFGSTVRLRIGDAHRSGVVRARPGGRRGDERRRPRRGRWRVSRASPTGRHRAVSGLALGAVQRPALARRGRARGLSAGRPAAGGGSLGESTGGRGHPAIVVLTSRRPVREPQPAWMAHLVSGSAVIAVIEALRVPISGLGGSPPVP